MKQETFDLAKILQDEINHLNFWKRKASEVVVYWRTGYDGNGQIENKELNKIISDAVCEFVDKKVSELKDQFTNI